MVYNGFEINFRTICSNVLRKFRKFVVGNSQKEDVQEHKGTLIRRLNHIGTRFDILAIKPIVTSRRNNVYCIARVVVVMF